jgi:hypothetical protein
LQGAAAGLRSCSLDWTGDPEPYLALVPAYGEREEALIENPATQ